MFKVYISRNVQSVYLCFHTNSKDFCEAQIKRLLCRFIFLGEELRYHLFLICLCVMQNVRTVSMGPTVWKSANAEMVASAFLAVENVFANPVLLDATANQVIANLSLYCDNLGGHNNQITVYCRMKRSATR